MSYRIYPPNLDAVGLQKLFDGKLKTLPMLYRKEDTTATTWKESNNRIKVKETFELYNEVKLQREDGACTFSSKYFKSLMADLKAFLITLPDVSSPMLQTIISPAANTSEPKTELQYLTHNANSGPFCVAYIDKDFAVCSLPNIVDALQPVEEMCAPIREPMDEPVYRQSSRRMRAQSDTRVHHMNSRHTSRRKRAQSDTVLHSADTRRHLDNLKTCNQYFINAYCKQDTHASSLTTLRNKRCSKLLTTHCNYPFRIITFVSYVFKKCTDEGTWQPMYSMRELTVDDAKKLVAFDSKYRERLCKLYGIDVTHFQD